jgi:imidazolonepropionase-like amidohydrolase
LWSAWTESSELSPAAKSANKDGIPIVAGTDGAGLELVRELELYVRVGFTPEEALAAATVVPARLLGVESSTGSIAVGRNADLVVVEGDPSHRIGDLSMSAGR